MKQHLKPTWNQHETTLKATQSVGIRHETTWNPILFKNKNKICFKKNCGFMWFHVIILWNSQLLFFFMLVSYWFHVGSMWYKSALYFSPLSWKKFHSNSGNNIYKKNNNNNNSNNKTNTAGVDLFFAEFSLSCWALTWRSCQFLQCADFQL